MKIEPIYTDKTLEEIQNDPLGHLINLLEHSIFNREHAYNNQNAFNKAADNQLLAMKDQLIKFKNSLIVAITVEKVIINKQPVLPLKIMPHSITLDIKGYKNELDNG